MHLNVAILDDCKKHLPFEKYYQLNSVLNSDRRNRDTRSRIPTTFDIMNYLSPGGVIIVTLLGNTK